MADSLMMAESSHSVYVNRLASQEVNKLNEFWGGYLRLLQNALGDYDSVMTQRQFNKLIKDVDGVIIANMEEWQHQLTLDLDEFAEYETDFQARMIGAVTDQDIAVPAAPQVIAAAIANPIQTGAGAIQFEQWMTNISSQQRQRIEGEIKLGYANGLPTNTIVQRIVGTRTNKFTDGIADVDRRSAVTLVRTSTNHYANEARKQVYKDNKRVVIGHRWVSTLDKRTSNICRDRDGDVYIYADDKPVYYPPAHANCRSSTSPVVKGYNTDNPNGKRSSKGGKLVDGELKQDPKQVSATQAYYDWLKNQPAQFQDDVLGKTKGKIFRNSGVSVDKFKTLMIDRMNKPMTIDQMAAKDQQIADYLKSLK